MKHPLRWTALGVGALVATLGVVLATQVGSEPTYRGGPIVGHHAPGFDLPVLSATGAKVDLATLAGKAVIVNFWNSWCIPCREETPALAAFWARHAREPDVAMVGIVRDDTAAAARAYARDQGMSWTIASDPDGQAALAYGTTGQPETYAISPAGVVTGKQLSRLSANNLEALLESARAG